MNRTAILKAILDVLFYSGASQGFQKALGGMGAIFMLHHVRPNCRQADEFAPNCGLEICPDFLDATITRVVERGYELITLDELAVRMQHGEPFEKPFAAFTLDDGYRDNLEYALPVFKRHQCPFTIFVAPSITDGDCELWWHALEAILRSVESIDVTIEDIRLKLTTENARQKQFAFESLYWPLRTLPEREQRSWIRSFAIDHQLDLNEQCRALAMDWEELRKIAAEPLCTIGAHTVNHFAIAKLSCDEAMFEATESRSRIEKELGSKVSLFAYPYGDKLSAGQRDFEIIRSAGFTAAVTTRKGLITNLHRHQLTSLPRVALNGNFQQLRHLDVLLSGTAFALWNAFHREAAA